jgi:diguanylate cyclase (GGDEF)-like protein
VADCLKVNLRKIDITARIGGDEFACLFPETGQTEAKIAFEKATDMLQRSMKKHGWPVTFSAGLVTFDTQPEDIEEALRIADELMYSVKNSKKNNIAYKVWKGKT